MYKFYWEKIDEEHALLMGPEDGDVAAVIVLDPGDPELMDSEWRVMSQSYRLLNFREEDASLSLERIQRRAIILLGQELHGRKRDLEDAMSSVVSMLLEDTEEAGEGA